MHDLRWSIPVARWSSWPADADAAPDVRFIEPMVRRRLSTLSRVALKVAHDCAADCPGARTVFASRHGELRRTTEILRSISAGEPVSPTAFSLSVLNAMTGVFGIARSDRSAASALSAGGETLGYALLEAYAQYECDPSAPVLLVYADEPADSAYGTIEEEVHGGALAILLDRGRSGRQTGRLSCSRAAATAISAASVSADSGGTPFATQSEAVHHCIRTGASAQWRGEGAVWAWSWDEGTA